MCVPSSSSIIPNQSLLAKQIHSIFPNEQIKVDVKKESNIKYSSGQFLELDIYIPKLELAFEFQDSHHYVTTYYAQRKLNKYQNDDRMKKGLVSATGLTFIAVPCWWSGDIHSLSGLINFHRPDLLTSHNNIVSLNPPRNFFRDNELLDIGELMTASFPTDYSLINSIQPHYWWVGEKYDGVRFCWNPNRYHLYTKHGYIISLSSKFEDALPSTFMEGEIWGGREYYNHANSFIHNTSKTDDSSIRFLCFDVPAKEFQQLDFETRYNIIFKTINSSHPFCIIVPRATLKDGKHLMSFTQGIIGYGGEGSVLRKILSFYSPGRSSDLLKFKSTYADKEGLVVKVDEEFVHIELPGGQTFTVPFSSILVESIPSKGDVVTFAYDINSKMGHFANNINNNTNNNNINNNSVKIIRTRTDMTWKDVLQSHAAQNIYESKIGKLAVQGLWTKTDMRAFMEQLAKSFGLDPHSASTWLKIPQSAVLKSMQGSTILQKFGGYFKALRSLFPNIELNSSSPTFLQDKWDRRKFLEHFAKTNKFDPLSSEGWHAWLYKQKRLRPVVRYYGSLTKALKDLFPEVSWELTPWREEAHRRKFFEQFAERNKFDPLILHNWIGQREQFLQEQYTKQILHFHGKSMFKALKDLFPEMESWKDVQSSEKWNDQTNRRSFFEQIAEEYNFDPLIATNWYQHLQAYRIPKSSSTLLSHHSNNIHKALSDLFPEVQWSHDPSSKTILRIRASPWKEEANRRTFFIDFAKEHNFDPLVPENWKNYLQVLQNTKNIYAVTKYYGESIFKALISLFPEVQWQKSSYFEQSINSKWVVPENRRKFFEDFAKKNNFDPLKPEEWAPHFDSVRKAKNAHAVLVWHGRSLLRSLLDLFPEVNWAQFQFSKSQNQWYDEANRRQFFIDFAKIKNFDPSIPCNWDNKKKLILAEKNSAAVLVHHHDSVFKALKDLFPEINWHQRSNKWSPLYNIPKSKKQKN